MRDGSSRYQVQTVPGVMPAKRLGGYLIEAGLLTTAQVDVALNDQEATGLRFGEVIAARGWVKQQTIDYLMKKVVVPERKAIRQRQGQTRTTSEQMTANRPTAGHTTSQNTDARRSRPSDGGSSFGRRDVPISKPLPPVSSSDGDVSWVG